jgi:hypothetical protein
MALDVPGGCVVASSSASPSPMSPSNSVLPGPGSSAVVWSFALPTLSSSSRISGTDWHGNIYYNLSSNESKKPILTESNSLVNSARSCASDIRDEFVAA